MGAIMIAVMQDIVEEKLRSWTTLAAGNEGSFRNSACTTSVPIPEERLCGTELPDMC